MLTRVLMGPLFGAALASGWWAWALYAPRPINDFQSSSTCCLLLLLVPVVFGFVVLVEALEDLTQDDTKIPKGEGRENTES